MKLTGITLLFLTAGILFLTCGNQDMPIEFKPEIPEEYYLGADLSYVNEMLDCGGVYRENGNEVDPYVLFAGKGASLVRVRFWNNPDWTQYSDFGDVYLTILRSKAQGMAVLLDYHLSDTWADPAKQIIPKAWSEIDDMEILGDSVYNFISSTLRVLGNANLLPEFVQVGNETNNEILQPGEYTDYMIDWERNNFLFGKGLAAVKDVANEFGKEIGTMIHIAQPENAQWWFGEAKKNDFPDFDWIGISYYPKWSQIKMAGLSQAIKSLMATHNKKLMIVETAYPQSLDNADPANNILGTDALLAEYPATPTGQRNYIIDLTRIVLESGGQGVIYWEPAWISTSCSTLWGQGSHWDNATFFDAANNNEVLPAFDFFKKENYE
jgi:arabinogalactan endo-1,4-beta-galactosidase